MRVLFRGTSKHIQHKVNAYLISYAIFAVLCLSLILFERYESELVKRFKKNLLYLNSYPIETLSIPFKESIKFSKNLIIFFQNQQIVDYLIRENHLLKRQLVLNNHFQHENKALRNLINMALRQPYHFVSSRIIADHFGGYMRSVLIDIGEAQGVRANQPVLGSQGLVGRIIDVNKDFSRVLLITDINSRIPVMLEESRQKAILAGRNTDKLELLYLPIDLVVLPGTRIVTSGDAGVFPPGLPVGIVVDVSDKIYVHPFVRWNQLEIVSILTEREDKKINKYNMGIQ